jgi:hypothetical protein
MPTKKPKQRKTTIAEIRRRLRKARAYHKLVGEYCETIQHELQKAVAAQKRKS